MKKLFNGWSAGCILALAASFSFVSCVNEEYDLSQGIDTNMTLLQNTTIPLGKVAPIPLSSLLGDLEGSDSTPLKVDEQGNISLSFGNDRITQSFTMPEVEIGGEGSLMKPVNTERYKISDLSLGCTVLALDLSYLNFCHFSVLLNL